MNTTEGWFKAQLLFHTLQKMPPAGSLQEWVLILYLDKTEDIEHSKFRALVQVVLTVGAENQDAGLEAFEEYMNKAFPSLKTKKKKKRDELMDVLKQWVGQGPLRVSPMGDGQVRGRSKMVKRIASVETGAVARATARIGNIRPR